MIFADFAAASRFFSRAGKMQQCVSGLPAFCLTTSRFDTRGRPRLV
jgi:hypothetical protein